MPVLTGPLHPDHGAVVELEVGVSGAREAVLTRHNLAVPARVRVRVQIDTGAGMTTFAPHVFQSLNIRPTGAVGILTQSTGLRPYFCDQFDVSLSLSATGGMLRVSSLQVLESVFPPAGTIEGLLGRDMLRVCQLLYDGCKGSFRLDF